MAKRILLIEDEPDFRLLLATLLAGNGYQAEILDEGREVLAALEAQRPDLVLLDFMMPGRSGLSVCKEIRGHWSAEQLPILLVTGLLQDASGATDELEALFAEHDVPFPEGVIEKPIRPPELLTLVAELTGDG